MPYRPRFSVHFLVGFTFHAVSLLQSCNSRWKNSKHLSLLTTRQKSKNWPIPISHTSKTTQRKNIAQSNNNNTNTNNKNNNIKEEEEEQHFFDEDCHVVPEYVPVELIDANDVEQVSELYSSVNTGVEFFPSAAATTANVYVPTAKSQKRSSFEDFLGEFIGYEETIDDAIVPTF